MFSLISLLGIAMAVIVSSPPVANGWTTTISISAVNVNVSSRNGIGGIQRQQRRLSTMSTTRLFEKAPKHDVGGNPLDQLQPDQKERVQAFMEYQQNLPRIGFPTDVRSLVQYNHGFAVMSTNSKL
jgi:hypothetical protein